MVQVKLPEYCFLIFSGLLSVHSLLNDQIRLTLFFNLIGMKASEIIIIHPAGQGKIQALKAFLGAMKIEFEITQKSRYKADFVEKVAVGDKAIKKGKTKSISLDDIWKSS
ncbi:MAG TPA: hypothetical protein PLK63_14860 [Catalimonadaceae bacterium]|jgi:hypothetical protein|nr:hypothetical protein [Catalimonadaceae bacterium]